MNQNFHDFYRGEIYYAFLEPAYGHEQGGTRPVLILQNDVGNYYSPTVIVTAATTQKHKKQNLPTHVELENVEGLPDTSVFMLEVLRTIVEALAATRHDRKALIPYLTEQLERSFIEESPESVDTEQLIDQIRILKQQVMTLMTESISHNTLADNEEQLKAMSDEIASLNKSLTEQQEASKSDHTIENNLKTIGEALENEPDQMSQYNEVLVRQLIETIKVIDRGRLLITFRGGLQYLQTIEPNIRRMRSRR